MKLKRQLVLIALIVFCHLGFSVYAQSKGIGSTSKINQATKENLIFIDVSVWNKKNFIKDLQENNFEILEKKKKLKIRYVNQTNEPASVGILFDTSGSTVSTQQSEFSEIPLAVDGLIRFINQSNAANEYFFVSFAKEPEVLFDFTQESKVIENALKKVLSTKPEGNTSIFDALDLGYKKVLKGKYRKKILLVISDGEDNSSRKIDYGDIKKLSKRENVQIYSVNILRKDEFALMLLLQSADRFKELAENSGGRVLYPRNLGEIHQAFNLIAEELKSQYTIGFEIDKAAEKKSWNKIKVKVNLSDKERDSFGKISVLFPEGYYY